MGGITPEPLQEKEVNQLKTNISNIILLLIDFYNAADVKKRIFADIDQIGNFLGPYLRDPLNKLPNSASLIDTFTIAIKNVETLKDEQVVTEENLFEFSGKIENVINAAKPLKLTTLSPLTPYDENPYSVTQLQKLAEDKEKSIIENIKKLLDENSKQNEDESSFTFQPKREIAYLMKQFNAYRLTLLIKEDNTTDIQGILTLLDRMYAQLQSMYFASLDHVNTVENDDDINEIVTGLQSALQAALPSPNVGGGGKVMQLKPTDNIVFYDDDWRRVVKEFREKLPYVKTMYVSARQPLPMLHGKHPFFYPKVFHQHYKNNKFGQAMVDSLTLKNPKNLYVASLFGTAKGLTLSDVATILRWARAKGTEPNAKGTAKSTEPRAILFDWDFTLSIGTGVDLPNLAKMRTWNMTRYKNKYHPKFTPQEVAQYFAGSQSRFLALKHMFAELHKQKVECFIFTNNGWASHAIKRSSNFTYFASIVHAIDPLMPAHNIIYGNRDKVKTFKKNKTFMKFYRRSKIRHLATLKAATRKRTATRTKRTRPTKRKT